MARSEFEVSSSSSLGLSIGWSIESDNPIIVPSSTPLVPGLGLADFALTARVTKTQKSYKYICGEMSVIPHPI